MTTPKIGLYTGGTTEPNNPLRPLATSAYPGHCSINGNTTYCAALFVLTQKLGLPADTVLPVTSTDLAARRWPLRRRPDGGTTSARNAGITTLNTSSTTGWGLSTPGSLFTTQVDVTNPVAWGFDNGAFNYRKTTSDPVYDGATLGSATAPFRYADPLKSFGFAQGALDAGR
jgi:hypothetical protein